MNPLLTHRRRLLAAAAGSLALAATAPLHAQGFPNKPIRLMVGYSAGGGVDAVARLLADRLPALLGQQVIVENRTGAAGQIAADTVAKSAPDGHTLLMGESALMIARALRPQQAIDPLAQFTPVAGAFVSPLVIISGNDFPARTPAELVQLLKRSPGRYSYASSGVGTVQHLGFEMLKQASGSFVVHIPYRGASQIVPDVIGGQVPLGVVSVTAAMAQARAGRVRALALMSAQPLDGIAVQPMASALPGFDVAPRLFLLAPAGTPADVVSKLSGAVKTVLAQPETAAAAAAQGTLRAYLDPAPLGQEMRAESERWRKLVAEQRITAEGN